MKRFFLLSIAVLLLNVSVFAQGVYLKVETFKIPHYKSNLPPDRFSGIGIDSRNGHISLSGEDVWCEIPYRAGQPDFARSFIAPTKGFQLTAVASAPGGVYVYDSLSNAIMAGNASYPLSQRMNRVTGMAYYRGKIYIADDDAGQIYEIQLSRGKAEIERSFKAHHAICGLAADSSALYSCDNQTIYAYDAAMNVVARYKLDVRINGLTVSGPDEFLAPAQNKNEIYRIRK
ncbi:MAG: hypothetical protein ABIJ41_05140 [Candidatus Omnitrophota bacterium]